MSVFKFYSVIGLCAVSVCFAAWSGKAERPKCDEEAITAYGFYQCEVSTPEQLAGLREMLESLTEVPVVSLSLENDLVFGDDPTSVSKFEWKPIARFDGVFNGNDHTISGLNIVSSDSALGLFGVFNGEVKDLTIAHSTLNYKSDSTHRYPYLSAGFFAGLVKSTKLYNVQSKANTLHFNDSLDAISSEVYLGGIVGALSGSVEDCSNTSDIIANFNRVEAYVGGIVGYASSISNSTNSGNITVTGEKQRYGVYVGGLVGRSGKLVTNGKNSGTVLAEAYRVGGIVGYGEGLDSCENTGSVTNTFKTQSFDSSFVGGLAGTSGQILNSINKGKVNGDYAGGLAGRIVASQKNINEGSVSGSLYAGGIGGVCARNIMASINNGSIEGKNAGGLCGFNSALLGTSFSYSDKVKGTATTGGVIAVNNGLVIGGYYDSTKLSGVQPIGVDTTTTFSWEVRGLPTKDMQTIEFANKLNDVGKSGNSIRDGVAKVLWTTTGSYPFFADSVNLPIQKIFLDDSLYVKTVYTDSKGHLQNIPLAVSKENRYFQGWVDSVGTLVTKTTVFTDSQTVYAKFSSTITDPSLVVYTDNTSEKDTIIGWDGEYEVPVMKMHKDSSLYLVISTPGEFAWYIKNPSVDHAILANNIYLAKDTTKYLDGNYLTGNLKSNNVFDGDGHSIYGLNGRLFSYIYKGAIVRNVNLVNFFMNYKSAGLNDDELSTFAGINAGTIQNSSLRSATFDSTAKEVFAFVARNEETGVIENCQNYANFTEGTKSIQVIAGFVNYNFGTIRNVVNYGNIGIPAFKLNAGNSMNPPPGSIAGIAFSNGGLIDNAVNKGNLFAESSVNEQKMQIAGIANGGGNIKNSKNEGDISFNYNKNNLYVILGGITSGTATIDSSENMGTIKVDIADGITKSSLLVGGIGIAGSVKNSTNEGDIIAKDISSSRWDRTYIGGIFAGGTFEIDSCVNKGNIEGFIHVGGIIGEGGNGLIQNVRNSGKITAYNSPTHYTTEAGTHVGGIIGSSGGENKIDHAFNEGPVFAIANENDTTTSYVGGICGFSASNDMNIVSNTASISASGKKSFAGGISGFSKYNKLQNVYNWGEIKSDSAAGGIIGHKYIYRNYYENVYNAAPVKAAYVGPIEPFAYQFDRTFKDTTTSIFYDSTFVRDTADKVSMYYFDPVNPSGYNSKSYSAIVAITPMNTEAMQSEKFVNILNTSNNEKENSGIWTRNGGYPVFNDNPTPVVVSSSSQVVSSSSEAKSSSSTPVSSSSSAISSSSSESKAKSSSSARNSIALKAKNFNFNLEVSGRTILLSNIQGYANYALFDMQGKIVSAGALEKGNAQIDVPRAGSYIIRVGKKLQKVVVE